MGMVSLFPFKRCLFSRVTVLVLHRCLANGMDSTEQTMLLENAAR